eukprot:TRINITY_DN12625_c2_g1_i5.p1 TRINITY_DN12625_c2_g1~~TRINITY_DN12625_c2_g1_i5.p1  ORF type:complete len:498 (-),score=60.63 TRINITY_DN12625_c2_g1_i5:495-1988(-)
MDQINIGSAAVCLANLLEGPGADVGGPNEKQGPIVKSYYVLLDLMEQNCEKMDNQSIANCVRSLGKAAIKFWQLRNDLVLKDMLRSLTRRAMNLASDFQAKELSNMLWMMGKLNEFRLLEYGQYQQFVAMALDLGKHQIQYSSRDVCDILVGMGCAKYENAYHISGFIDMLNVDELGAQELGNLMWSLMHLGYNDEEIIVKMISRIINQHETFQFDLLGLSNILSSLSDLGLPKSEKSVKFLILMLQKLKPLYAQEGTTFQAPCNVLFSLALLEQPASLAEPILELLLKRLDDPFGNQNESQKDGETQDYLLTDVLSLSSSSQQTQKPPQSQKQIDQSKYQQQLSEIQFVQLAHVWLYYKFLQGVELKIPEFILEEGMRLKRNKVQNAQKKVSRTVGKAFHSLQKEFSKIDLRPAIEDGLMSVDIGFEQYDKKFGVQVCDKWKYFLNQPGRLKNKADVHVRVLREMGWEILVVQEERFRDEEGYRKQIMQRIYESIS